MTTADHAEPTTAAVDLLDDAVTGVAELLTTLANLIPLVGDLTNSRQRGLGFMTFEGKRIQDEMVRSEREDLDKRIRRAREKNLLPLDGFVGGRGESPAPVNIVAGSIDAHVHTTLHHTIKQLVGDLAKHGICTLTRVPEDATSLELVAVVRQLIWQCVNIPLLDAIDRDLEDLIENARRLIDGEDRVWMNAECPHCENRTLVAFLVDDLIRCDRHPKTGRYEPCTCSDPLCECKTRPHRHEWFRNKKPDWEALNDRIDLKRSTQQ